MKPNLRYTWATTHFFRFAELSLVGRTRLDFFALPIRVIFALIRALQIVGVGCGECIGELLVELQLPSALVLNGEHGGTHLAPAMYSFVAAEAS